MYGTQTIGMCSHKYQITFFITSSSVCCGQLCFVDHIMTTARSCHILHSTRTITPQHLLYKAPGSSLFWIRLYCRTTSICHPTPRGLSKYCLFSTSRNSLTLLFSGLFTGCQYLQEFNWKHRFWLTLLPIAPITFMPLSGCVSLHVKGSCLFSSRNFFILVFDFHIVLKGNFYISTI